MANQALAAIKQVPGWRPDEIDQQIRFDVAKNARRPQPTTPKKSGVAEVSPSQSRCALRLSRRIRGALLCYRLLSPTKGFCCRDSEYLVSFDTGGCVSRERVLIPRFLDINVN